jgi:release factor glutamine methyltransferase
MKPLCPRIDEVLCKAKAMLSSVTDVPGLEAEILLAHLLKKPRSFLHAWPDTLLTEEEQCALKSLIERRKKHEPIAYIIGHREFWTLQLFVNEHTLIPRPETEILVEKALGLIKKESLKKVADLGTGSGAIGLALASECKDAEVFAIDISEDALKVASFNAKRLGIENISFYQGNWCGPLPCTQFDLIVSNPPYLSEDDYMIKSKALSFEPRLALLSSKDGLGAAREIAETAKCYLKSGGYLLLEHGALQGTSVRKIFALFSYTNISTLKDLSGLERVTIARYF